MIHKIIQGLLLVLVMSGNARLLAYSELVILGDSLSDTGNHPAALLGAPYPYFQNRISNGPVAVDVLAEALGLSAANSGHLFNNGSGSNYAVSGANAAGSELHGLNAQLAALLSQNTQGLDAEALYLVMIGGNDVRDASVMDDYSQGDNAIILAGDAIRNVVQQLITAGAKSLLVSNVPDISSLPETHDRAVGNPGLISRAGNLSRAFNAHLEMQLDELSRSTGMEIKRFDFYAAFDRVLLNPSKYGFSNKSEACFNYSPYTFHPQCDFDRFVFFDSIHPTAKAHRLLGEGLFEVIEGKHRIPGILPGILFLLLN